MRDQEIICINTRAYYALLDQVLEHIQEKFRLPKEPDWVDTETALQILNIRSRTTLQNLRDAGKVAFSQTTRKNILYRRQSLFEYIESATQNKF